MKKTQVLPQEKKQKQHLIDMMKQDEELGLYEQTKCYCGHTITCDCGPKQETHLKKHLKSLKYDTGRNKK